MKNFPITDQKTGKEYWISRSVAVCALVIVHDEPNGKQYRISDSYNPGDYDKLSNISSANSTNGQTDITYTFENTNYVHKKYVIINKRGEGTPDFQGCWNVPCGYLDFDETLKEACSRELREENMVDIPVDRWQQIAIEDDPHGRQNVTVRFVAEITMDELQQFTLNKPVEGGEVNEIAGRELMELTEDNINGKDWAFNHADILIPWVNEPIYIL